MMKLSAVVVVLACAFAVGSAQLLTALGSTTYSHESTAQQHSPWAASASSRSQVHGPDATLLAAAPVETLVPLAPIAHLAPAAPALPLYLRR